MRVRRAQSRERSSHAPARAWARSWRDTDAITVIGPSEIEERAPAPESPLATPNFTTARSGHVRISQQPYHLDRPVAQRAQGTCFAEIYRDVREALQPG